MNDEFIKLLVDDLEPRRPVKGFVLLMHCVLCLIAACLVILFLLGLRDDHALAIANGVMFWKPGIFMLAWIGSLLLITDIMRPTGKIKPTHYVPLVFSVAIYIAALIWQSSLFGLEYMLEALRDPSAVYCFSAIISGGAIVMLLMWLYWFKIVATPSPAVFGGLAGLNSGCLMAVAYAIHCRQDAISYITVYYGLSILFLLIIGAFFGKKLLRW